VLERGTGPVVEVDGQRLIYLGGTNYFGMSSSPDVTATLKEAVERWGLSPGGGRTTSGTALPHLELEARIEELLGAAAAVLAASGYVAGSILVQAFSERYDVCLVDELSHASLRDAARGAGLPSVEFAHRDPDDLQRKARALRAEGRRVLVATDGVFPTDGTLAPLVEYRLAARELEIGLLVDDAHGIGVLGSRGGGLPEHLAIPPSELLYAGSLSKAFGAFGGFAAGTGELRDLVRRSGAYVGATPLPPALAVAARRAVEIVRGDQELRRRLRENTDLVHAGLASLGIEFPGTPMPIARFVLGDADHGRMLHDELRHRGILIPFNTYPGGPEGGYFRLAVSAAHTPEQIREAIDALRSVL
jgi:8-amino-7-oxononanoate synthase